MKRKRNTVLTGKRIWPVLTLMAFWGLAFWGSGAQADIYRYVDSNGVLHFTNTPTSSRFTLYLRENKGGGRPIVNSTKSYDSLIRAAGEKFGLEAALIRAVIHAESNFDPRAVSRKGARGLMQIMPENNIALNISNAFDPAQNIMGGTYYLKQLLIRYKNRLALALAAYNAGPEAVDKYRKIPPFDETQAYVKKVMGLYNRYRQI